MGYFIRGILFLFSRGAPDPFDSTMEKNDVIKYCNLLEDQVWICLSVHFLVLFCRRK